MKRIFFALFICGSICCGILSAQEEADKLDKYFENLNHKLNSIEKLADDILWYHKVGDVARIDKVYMTGHPDNYKVAYAGVPVSDLIARMGYQTQGYRELYSADYHIGKTAYNF